MSMNFGNFSTSNFQTCLTTNNLSGKLRAGLGVSISDRNGSSDNNNFLMISKSRIPDIQMINRYYGLVPKKFAINSRNTDQSSKPGSTKLRAKSAYTFDYSNNNSQKGGRSMRNDSNSFYSCGNLGNNASDEKYNDPQSKSHSVQYSIIGETKSRRKSETSQNRRGSLSGQVEVVAKKMPVEKYKRWKRAKSLSLMDNNANVTNNSGENDNRNFQRVIKIDLNNMRWEESYQTKTTSSVPLSVDEHSTNDVDLLSCPQECDRSNPTDGFPQVQNENATKTTTSSSLISNNDTNNLNSPGVCANGSVTKRGSLRKTISFDEQLLQSTPAENAVAKPDTAGKIRRPMTAAARPSQNSVNSSKVAAWTTRTGQTTSERRSKLQKSNSIQSDRDQFSSVDTFGQGESDNEQDPSADFPSWAYRESRRTLHVQALPEVSTMVSAISPPADEEIQLEIEKVAQMLNNLQSQEKCFTEPQANVKSDLVISESICKSESQHSIGTSADIKCNGSDTDRLKKDNSDPNADVGSANVLPPVEKVAVNGDSNVVADGKRVPRRPFKKSVSISCEKELYSATVSGNQSESANSTKNIKSCRPKTATPVKTITRGSSSGARSTATSGKQSGQLSSEKTNSADQSQGSKARKILIKKALIEINQASTGFGKRVGVMGRPKTAPIPDKKPPSPNNIPQRIPFKAARRLSPSSTTGEGKGAVHSPKKNILAQKMEPATPEKVDSEEQKSPISSPEVKHKSLTRQSFSLDDGLLLGFSSKEFSRDVNEDIKDAELSFLSSKKREECLKIYEKMMKTGCAIKLDTIFRGMMTPSEYRTFIKAAENAAKEAVAEAENEIQVSENDGHAGNAGVPIESSLTEVE